MRFMAHELPADFGPRLSSLMGFRDITVKTLADDLGISPEQLYRVLGGKQAPSKPLALLIEHKMADAWAYLSGQTNEMPVGESAPSGAQ